ncbi:hypothetical protein PRZ48_006116 [Zasmidium cellare]|uniref:Uncharacterized protein n=1 Tax=Zasmidium cellare TaxID=395010 RepID=A0ABR0EN61_ZASCE|nr:hypothetical protein PRZ48_006116 [Zasmidium cellare]
MSPELPSAMEIDTVSEEHGILQNLRDQCTNFETLLEQAETQYIRQGLQFHCMPPSANWPLKHVRQIRAAFVVTDGHIPDNPASNRFMTTLEHLSKQLSEAKGSCEAGHVQSLRDLLDKAATDLTAFNYDLAGLDTVAKELAALSGLRDLSVDVKAEPENETPDTGFRANRALWSWVMELPVVKQWLNKASAVSEELAFVKVVKLGDVEVQKKLLWVSE